MDRRFPPRSRSRRVIRLLTGCLLLAVLATDAWILYEHDRTTTVDLADALERYRTSAEPVAVLPSAAPASAEPGVVASSATPADPATPAAGGGPAAAPTTTGSASRAATATSHPTAPAPGPAPASSPYRRPDEGVYTYLTSGGESVSVADNEHRYPERTYTSVRHGEGCLWETRSDVVEEHVDHRVLCSRPGATSQLQQGREVEFFSQRDGFTMVCDPALLLHAVGEVPGASATTTCRGDEIEASITRTYVGRAVLQVGGHPVEVEQVRLEATFTGRATGRSVDDLWLHPETGLNVRWKRTVDTTADAAFGARVRYQEEADFLLASLEPQR